MLFFVREEPTGRTPSTHICSPEDARPLVGWLKDEDQEHFLVLSLNAAGGVIASRIITIGLLNYSLVHPREVFAPAISDHAASIICVHNHPSGTQEPSREDLTITRQLSQAGEILGINLLDHLIIAGESLISLKERGLM